MSIKQTIDQKETIANIVKEMPNSTITGKTVDLESLERIFDGDEGETIEEKELDEKTREALQPIVDYA
jgi:hypothetical protein